MITNEIFIASLISAFVAGFGIGSLISWRFRSYLIRRFNPIVPKYDDDQVIRNLFSIVVLSLFTLTTAVSILDPRIQISAPLALAMSIITGSYFGAEAVSRFTNNREGKIKNDR